MRTTVTIDDELLEAAMEYTGVREKSALMNKALLVAAKQVENILGRQVLFTPGVN